jgi:alkylation response protein AidB-like acyl-CoA dehydrogenase
MSRAHERQELVAAIFEAVQGITATYDRRWFLQRAREDGHARELWEALAENGLLAVGVPEEIGGAGGGLTGTAAVMEAMATAGVPPLLYSLTTFSREAILRHGSEAQVAEHVVPTVDGRRKFCFGVTEPDAGTNTFASRTTARTTGSGYVLNGQKVFISGADEADHMLLLARTAEPGETVGRTKGFGLFVVPMDRSGIQLTRMEIEWYAPERQFEVFLDGVEVGDEALIGNGDEGFRYLLDCLNQERVVVAGWALGLGTFALEKAVAYARQRAPFGTPIGAYQAVQHPLALAKANMEAARTIAYAAAAEYDDGLDAGAKANMAKLLATRAALDAVDAAIQTHGGTAFVLESDVVTLWPMIRVLQVAPLNNESILNYIGERVLGLPRSY